MERLWYKQNLATMILRKWTNKIAATKHMTRDGRLWVVSYSWSQGICNTILTTNGMIFRDGEWVIQQRMMRTSARSWTSDLTFSHRSS